MNKLLLSLLLASYPALSTPAEPASLKGTWQIHNSVAGNESDQSCTFVQNGNSLTGTCTSEKGQVPLTGEVKDKKVTWTYRSEYQGSPITLKYDGKLESDTKIVGNLNVAEYGVDGDFTATASK